MELVSLPYFLQLFWWKILLILYFINWPEIIAWQFLLHQILCNMCIVIICFPVDDFMNFEINFSFLIKPFSCMTKKVNKNLNILRTKRAY